MAVNHFSFSFVILACILEVFFILIQSDFGTFFYCSRGSQSTTYLRCTVVTSFGVLHVYSFPLHATYYHQLMLYSKIHMRSSTTQFISCLTKYDKIKAGLKAPQILKHEMFESYSPPPLSNYSINKQHAEFRLRCSNHKRSDSHKFSLVS